MKKLTLFVFSSMCLGLSAQQDPQYNLYQFNQMVLNPAYAGSRDGLSLVASNRQQWVGFDGAPKTTCLSIHGPVLRKNLGLGLTIVNDRMGPRDVTSAYGNFAYILKLNTTARLSFGLNAGYNRYQFNFDDIQFKADEVPTQLFDNQTKGTLDINAGLFLKSNSFFVGLSTTHINNPKVYSYDGGNITYRLGTHIFVTVGNSWMINKDIIFAPTAMIKITEGQMNADLNVNFFFYKKLWAGVFYRMGYGPGMLLQYYVNNRLRIGISYDSGLQSARRLGDSFEAMIGFDFAGNRAKMVNPRFL